MYGLIFYFVSTVHAFIAQVSSCPPTCLTRDCHDGYAGVLSELLCTGQQACIGGDRTPATHETSYSVPVVSLNVMKSVKLVTRPLYITFSKSFQKNSSCKCQLLHPVAVVCMSRQYQQCRTSFGFVMTEHRERALPDSPGMTLVLEECRLK